MENIAPAVVNGIYYIQFMFCNLYFNSFCISGGFSTMLALSLLVTSRSHVFTSFFKIFLMICLFGLFHGLIMLPVVLGLFGPVDISEEERENRQDRQENSYINQSEISKLFSLKFIRTLLSDKKSKDIERREKENNREMEVLKSNGVTDSLLDSKNADLEDQRNGVSNSNGSS